MSLIEDLSPSVLREFMFFMTGDKIGNGASRIVFDHPHDKTKVIKMENRADTFHNVREWQIWQDFQHVPSITRWLAPCHHISHSGTFLVMSKTSPLLKVPKMVPKFCTDHKMANYGMYKGRLVCHDYGHLIITLDEKMRKWNDNEKGYA